MNNRFRKSTRKSKQRLNEEISMNQVGMIMQAITALGPTGHTLSLQQAVSQYGNPQTKFDIKISVVRTSEHEVYYNLPVASDNVPAIQENLPIRSTKTHYLKGDKQKYLAAIKQGLPVFYYFDYITEAEAKQAGAKKTTNDRGTDITDFLKVGSEIVNEKGTMTIDLTDGKNEEIIASGNGLYLLVRTAANNQVELDRNKTFIKMNVLEMKSAKVDANNEFEDTNFLSIRTNSNKEEAVKEYIYYLFTISSKHYNDLVKVPLKSGVYRYQSIHGENKIGLRDGEVTVFKKGYGDIMKQAPLGPARDELVKDALAGQAFMLNDWLFPFDPASISDYLSGSKFKILSRDELQQYINEFNQAKTEEERDYVVYDFMTDAMDDYKNNFLNMVEDFAKDIGVSKEQILKEFDIDNGVNQTVARIKSMLADKSRTENVPRADPKVITGAFEYVKKISDIMGTIPGPTGKTLPPFKQISTSETEVKVGETKYQVRSKTASVDEKNPTDPTIKKESFKYVKTFERFRRDKF